MEFKDFLRVRRSELNISQTELADRISKLGREISAAQVSHWEIGRSNPPWENTKFRQALAGALEIELNEMMAQLGFITSEEARSKEARLAADIVDRLPPQARNLAIKQLQAIEQSFADAIDQN